MTTPTRRSVQARAVRTTPTSWTVVVTGSGAEGGDRTTGTFTAHGSAVDVDTLVDESRELAALWLAVRPEDIDVRLVIDIPDDARRRWAAATRPDLPDEEARVEQRRIARELGAAGYTASALAVAFDVSRSRAARLLRVDAIALARDVTQAATRALDGSAVGDHGADDRALDERVAGDCVTDLQGDAQ